MTWPRRRVHVIVRKGVKRIVDVGRMDASATVHADAVANVSTVKSRREMSKIAI
jgi:hypothetical protein